MVFVLVSPIVYQMRNFFFSKMTTTIGGYATRLHYQKTKMIIFVQNSIHKKKTVFQIGVFQKKMKKIDVQTHRKTQSQYYLNQDYLNQ